jgi:hypothetical protein
MKQKTWLLQSTCAESSHAISLRFLGLCPRFQNPSARRALRNFDRMHQQSHAQIPCSGQSTLSIRCASPQSGNLPLQAFHIKTSDMESTTVPSVDGDCGHVQKAGVFCLSRRQEVTQVRTIHKMCK